MNIYKKKVKVSSDLKCYKGDVMVCACYKENNDISNFALKLASSNIPVVVFNLRKSLRDKLTNDELNNIMICWDNNENTDIKYIETKCNELKKQFENFVVIIDYEPKLKSNNSKFGFKLKKLSVELNTRIFVLCDLEKKFQEKELPTSNYLNDKQLTQYADTIIFEYDDLNITFMVKNNYGRTGIMEFDNLLDV